MTFSKETRESRRSRVSSDMGVLPRRTSFAWPGFLLDKLAGAYDLKFILERYSIPSELAAQISTLNEVRNAIVHPPHRPGADRNNTPAYLSTLRESGLLQSTGKELDYIWIAQLQSHKLFRWAFETIQATVNVLISTHQVSEYATVGLRESYSRYTSTMEPR